MMQMDDQLVDAVKDIEDQHKGMLKIEQGVREIQELFQDMAVLVDLQQETLDVIERNVQDTAKYTRDAEKNITQAEVYQKNSRKVNYCASLYPPLISIDHYVFTTLVSLSVCLSVCLYPRLRLPVRSRQSQSQCYIILLLLIICAVIIFFLWK